MCLLSGCLGRGTTALVSCTVHRLCKHTDEPWVPHACVHWDWIEVLLSFHSGGHALPVKQLMFVLVWMWCGSLYCLPFIHTVCKRQQQVVVCLGHIGSVCWSDNHRCQLANGSSIQANEQSKRSIEILTSDKAPLSTGSKNINVLPTRKADITAYPLPIW
jgi:hypothetical protein